MDTERPRQRRLAAIGVCLALWGCAGQPDRLPVEAGDVCGGQRAELAKFQGYYGTVIAPGIERVSSTVGGVIGTVVDTFRPNPGGSGTAAGQRIGARAGAAVGRFGGYFLAKVAKFGGNTQALTASVHADIQAENAEIDRAAVAFADLQRCRFAEAAEVKADLRAKRIDREEAQRRLDDIRGRFDADAAAAQMIGIKMNEKGQEFQYASAELIKLDPETQADVAQQSPKTRSKKARARKGSGQARRTEKPAPATSEAERDVSKPNAAGVANVTETNVVKAKSFNDQVSKAQAAAQPALSLEGTVGFLLPEGTGMPAMRLRVPEGLLVTLLTGSTVSAAEVPTDPILRLEAGVHTAAINKAAVTGDGRLLTVSDDKTARLWNAEGGIPLTLRVPIGPGDEGALFAVAASPTKGTAVVAGRTGLTWDGTDAIYGLDLNTGRITGRISGLPGTVHALSYSKDGRYLAAGTGAGVLMVHDLERARVAAEDSAAGSVTASAFLIDGRLVTASLDGQVRLYDASFRITARFSLPQGMRPWRIAVAPEATRIAVGAIDAPVVHILSTNGLKPVTRLTGDPKQRGAFSVVAWAGTRVLAAGTYGDASGTKRLRAWDMASGRQAEADIADDTVTDLVVLPDGRVAFTTAEPSLGLVDPETLAVSARRRRLIPDFRNAFQGTFRLARDGSVIDFGLGQNGNQPVRFDWSDRSLTVEPSPRPDVTAPRIPDDVRDWQNGREPTYRGVPIRLQENEIARAVAASADGSALLLGADYSLRLLRGDRALWGIPVPSPAWAVNLSADGRYAVAAFGDGTLRWYSAAGGAELLALFVTTDGRWIAWTPEGYFDHAKGAEGLVGYHINRGKAIDPDFVLSGQLHARFYRPDLMALKLRGEDLAAVLARTGDVKTVVATHRAPDLQMLAWCVRGTCNEAVPAGQPDERPSIRVDLPEITLRIAVSDRGSGAGRVIVRRNQATVATSTGAEPAGSGSHVEELTVALEPGDNLITLSAYDSQQVVEGGEAVRLNVHYEESKPRTSDLYLLSIGINRYRNPEVPELSNAVNDAKGMAEVTVWERYRLFNKIQATVLVDAEASLSDIRAAFARTAALVKPEDVVVLFLAGHGVALEGRYYFLPHDVSAPTPEAIKASGLGHDGLAELLATLPTTRAAVIIDTCFAGAFAVKDVVLRHTRDRTWINSLGMATGRFTLAGTSNQQEALDGIAGHGVFTATVLGGLQGPADAQSRGNRDGRIDVIELGRYAELQVPLAAKRIEPTHEQKPTWYFAGSDVFDISTAQ